MKKSRIPPIKKDSDDFTMEFAGEEYKPHEGECVWFVPYLSTRDTLSLLEAVDRFGGDDALQGLRVILDDIAPILARIIDGWTWTSVLTGEPLGKKDGNGDVFRPGLDDVSDLSTEELTYLISAYLEARGVTGEGSEGEENPQ